MSVKFYNPKRLLNMKDKNKNTPELLISISNRGAGKTYGFAKFLLDGFLNDKRKFGLLCRWQRELGSTAKGIFKTLLNNEYPDLDIYEKVMLKGVYSEIYIKEKNKKKDFDVCCGYVLPINGGENFKTISSMFVDIDIFFFDEFQCHSYCPKEIDKFINLHFSIARGGDEGVRFLPVILASNSLSIVNPYFQALGLTNKIQPDTHFYRGEGLVLERFVNEDVAKKQAESPFNIAFSKNKQVMCNINNSWLNDSWSCISKPAREWGRSTFMCAFIDSDVTYGLYLYANGLYYIGRTFDKTAGKCFSLSVDGTENVESIQRSSSLLLLRTRFLEGKLRFSDITVKTRFLEFI